MNQPVPVNQKRVTWIGRLFNLIFGFIGFILGSALLSILVEWLGLYFDWYASPQHAQEIFQQEYQVLDQSVKQLGQYLSHITSVFNGVNGFLSLLHEGVQSLAHLQSSLMNRAGDYITFNLTWIETLKVYLNAALYVLMTVVVRASILFLSTPIFLMAVFIGFVDGLVERELRKWGGGRESSNQYKIAKSLIIPAYLMAWMLYLSYPQPVHHLLVVLPCAVLLSYMVRHTCYTMKKYF